MTKGSHIRVIYISYDGISEPLGRSQVLAYLVRLARSCDITLISFQKERARQPETAAVLREAGISWIARSYHRRPPVFSTLWDVVSGVRAVRRALRRSDVDIVHVRGYVPALIALLSAWPRARQWRLLFDIRGFWPDERVLAGAWSERSFLFRVAKRCERWFFDEADAVVTLTQASVPQIRAWMGFREAPVRVIPTCTDVARFSGSMPGNEGPRAVWCGSIGTFYRFDLAVRFVDALGIPLLVLTREVEAAKEHLGERQADVRTVPHEEIARELRPGDIGLCFYATGRLGNLGRAPTRIAEYLAASMAVAVTPGIGDLDAIVDRHNLGVRIEDESEAGLAGAAAKVLALAADSDVRARGPRLAAELYSVDDGADAYLDLYRQLQGGHATADHSAEQQQPGGSVSGGLR